jgi:hypothetical protein
MADKPVVKITLTVEQQQQLRQATGRQVRSLKLDTLEARLSPGVQFN